MLDNRDKCQNEDNQKPKQIAEPKKHSSLDMCLAPAFSFYPPANSNRHRLIEADNKRKALTLGHRLIAFFGKGTVSLRPSGTDFGSSEAGRSESFIS